MKTRLFILCIFAVLTVLGMSENSFADKKIKLHLGQTVSAEGLTFTFQSVDDSRCPSDVTCVWGGQVIATIQIQNQNHTKTINFMPHDSYTFFAPYEITLIGVGPYPISTEQPDDHTVTLVIISTVELHRAKKTKSLKMGYVSQNPLVHWILGILEEV